MPVVSARRLSPEEERLAALAAAGHVLTSQAVLALHRPLAEEALARAVAAVAERCGLPGLSGSSMAGAGSPSAAPVESAALAALLAAERRGLAHRGEGAIALRTLRRTAGETLAVLTLPASATDVPGLAALVGGIAAELEDASPEGAIRYPDFSAWRREWLAGGEEEGRSLWRGLDLSPSIGWELPGERSSSRPFEPSAWPVPLAKAVAEGLPARAEALGVSVAVWLEAAWSAFLARLSGRREVILGVAHDLRVFEELAGMVGPATVHLPRPAIWNARSVFGTAVREVAENAETAAFWREHFRWEDVEPPAGSAVPFSFPATLEVWPASGAVSVPPEAPLVCLRATSDSEPFRLALSARIDGSGAPELELRHDRHRFTAATAARLAASFGRFLTATVERPETRVGELELLPAAERRRLLVELQPPPPATPGTVLERIEGAARRHPERIALLAEETALSYGELERRARRRAARLAREGVRRGDRVAVFQARSPELAVTLLAVWKAGAAWVHLPVGEPRARLAHRLADAQVRVAVGAGEAVRAATGWEGPVVDVGASTAGEPGGSSPEAARIGPAPYPEGDDLAYVSYTSGSTGRPKGVLATHRGVATYLAALAERFPLTAEDRVLQVADPSFDASVRDLLGPLALGATVLQSAAGSRAPEKLFAEAERRRASAILAVVPTVLRRALATTAQTAAAPGTLRLVLVAGETLLGADVESLRERFGTGVEVGNLYGPTECTMTSTWYRVAPGRVARPDGAGALPVGRPLSGYRAYLLDPALGPLPVGAVGEVALGGRGLARGYLGRIAETAARFVPDPAGEGPGARLYRTGDLGRLREDGELELLGRCDRQVKLAGVRIEPGEVEAALRRLPGVRGAAVTAPGGRLTAYVAVDADAAPPERLRSALAAELPPALVPGLVLPLDSLPTTATGKVDWNALPDPADTVDEVPRIVEGALSPTAELLAEIWREILDVESPGRDDDFFALGGHSLLSLRLVARVTEAFGVELEVGDVFEVPTLGAQAARIEALTAGDPRLERPIRAGGDDDGERPLSFAEERQWLMAQLEPGSPVFNITRAVRLTGELHPRALARAVAEVTRRHETLRTVYPAPGGRPVPRVMPRPTPRLPLVDLSELPPAVRGRETRRSIRAVALRPFDLARGPLVRLYLLRLGETEHAVLVSMHHIVSDEWSLGVLVREIGALYRARLAREPSPLPELGFQYADFARWQRRELTDAALDEHLAFWRRNLAGAPAVLELGSDRANESSRDFAGGSRPLRLDPDITDALRRLARAEGATLFMVLLASFQALLHALSGREDLVVGAPVAGRDQRGLEGLIGYFVDALPLRADLSGDPSFVQLLGRTRETLLEAWKHRRVPFEKIVDAVAAPRSGNHPPIFQAVFNYYNGPEPSFELPDLSVTPMTVQAESSKYALTLYLGERDGEVAGALRYATSRFDAASAERVASEFEALVASVAERPERRLRQLVRDSRRRRKEGTMPTTKPKPDLGRLRGRRRAVTAPIEGMVRTRPLFEDGPLPLLVEPAREGIDLKSWLDGNLDLLERHLLEHGGVLLRGFDLPTAEAFHEVARTVCPELVNYFEGSSPRIGVSDKVYTSTEYPPELFVSLHNELSYAHKWPRKILFYCNVEPGEGGETPIADSRRVFDLVAPEIRERFLAKGVRYLRNLHGGRGAGLAWQTVFETDRREEVEAYCREGGIAIEWSDGGGVATRQVRPAAVRHPKTNDWLWFNQAHQFHPSNLGEEEAEALLSAAGDEASLPIHATYGDGEPLEPEALAAVRAAYDRAMVRFPWRRGDLLILDNMLAAHGRMPFSGPRKILVAMGETVRLEDVPQRAPENLGEVS